MVMMMMVMMRMVMMMMVMTVQLLLSGDIDDDDKTGQAPPKPSTYMVNYKIKNAMFLMISTPKMALLANPLILTISRTNENAVIQQIQLPSHDKAISCTDSR